MPHICVHAHLHIFTFKIEITFHYVIFIFFWHWLQENVTAVLTSSPSDVLSHVAIRARSQGVLLATCFDDAPLSTIKQLQGKNVRLDVDATGAVTATETAAPAASADPKQGIVASVVSVPVFSSLTQTTLVPSPVALHVLFLLYLSSTASESNFGVQWPFVSSLCSACDKAHDAWCALFQQYKPTEQKDPAVWSCLTDSNRMWYLLTVVVCT